ncbi:MAG: BREX-2 system adenine-specific DNA-methyltransferase PglX, partial [Isosphaeraceae bacterium]
MITANSFMKREFGKKLIEDFFPTVDLTHVIDTSGAYIPGHGTPTVILFGRNRRPVTSEVRAVLGIRGEPTTPDDPAQGLVWRSIEDHLDNGQWQNEFISVTDSNRETFGRHPWSMGGGGAAELKERIEDSGESRLAKQIGSIGFYQDTHADEAFVQPIDFVRRHRLQAGFREQVRGENVRDWVCFSDEAILFPYDAELGQWTDIPQESRWCWFLNLRTLLWSRSTFGGGTYRSQGRSWFDYHQFPKDRARTPLSITLAFVATHNHFVLDRSSKVFNRSAPIIKLPADATEQDHLALMGLLNSSTACFWMKQSFQTKGSSGIGRGVYDERWEFFYEFTGGGVGAFPVVDTRSETLRLTQDLDTMARRLGELSPAELIKQEIPTAEKLATNRAETERLQAHMVALQEELDWLCYRLYGLIDEPLEHVGQPPPAVPSQDRPRARPAAPEYRRKLPHLQAEGKTLEVTFCTWHRWELPEAVRGRVLQHCLHDHGTKLWMHAAVVMPDHVHLLFTPLTDPEGNTYGLAEIMSGIKGASAHSVNRILGRSGHVWQDESFDHILRSEERVEAKAEYICQNPVRKGLASAPDQYEWLWREGIEGKSRGGETAGCLTP